MRKKISVITLALLMIFLLVSTAWAVPGKGVGQGKFKKDTPADKVKTEIKSDNYLNKSKVQSKIKIRVKEQVKVKLHSQNQKHFKDANNHWAAKSIKKLSSAGLFNGYPDGTFKPDNYITQAETISLVMRLAEVISVETEEEDVNEDTYTEEENSEEDTVTEENNEDESDVTDNEESNTEEEENEGTNDEDNELSDVPEWAKNAANKAYKHNVININRFHSHVQASRAQAAVWIAKALDLTPVDTSELPFNDGILISEEDVGYILALYNEGIILGTPDGKFNPNSAITRAEMAAIMERLLEKDSNTDETNDDTIEEESDNAAQDTDENTEESGQTTEEENTEDNSAIEDENQSTNETDTNDETGENDTTTDSTDDETSTDNQPAE